MPSHVPVALNLLDPHSLLASAGALGIFLILFAETGLLVGFFLPGDSLLFTAGLLASTDGHAAVHLSLPAVLAAAAGGALVGAEVGYLIGARAGHALLDRPGRPRLRQGIDRARSSIDRYGVGRTVVLARFIPVVRTAVNPLAGAIGIPLRTFTIWQAIGGLVWSVGVTLAGYALGSRISNVDHYLLPIIAVIVLLSLIPVAVELFRQGGLRSAHKHGADNSGAGNLGADNSGAGNHGADNSGADNSGADNSGAGNHGADNSGADNHGTDDRPVRGRQS
jgi:membrane-associated protein